MRDASRQRRVASDGSTTRWQRAEDKSYIKKTLGRARLTHFQPRHCTYLCTCLLLEPFELHLERS